MKHQHTRHTFLAKLLTGLVSICLVSPALGDVSARLDRYKAYDGDPVTLTIESDGKQSGEPDLSALKQDFNIVGNSTSSQVSIINGRHSSKTSWIVQLEPRHLGKFRIPPIAIGSEETLALELEVTEIPEQLATQQSEHLFLEVEADHDGTVFVQQQTPYTVRFYFDDQVLNGELSAPQPEQAVVEQLGEEKRYTATRNNKSYHVIERHYAISAEKSGPLQIPPVIFKGQLTSPRKQTGYRSQYNRLINQFFSNSPFSNDPFFSGTPFADPGKPVRVRSKAVSLDVQPRPASAGNQWLPAEQLTLQDSWAEKPPRFRAGEPVTRSITIKAKGLTGPQIPALQLATPDQTHLYPESPVNESRTDGDKVYGVSKQNFTYIPGNAGTLTIPAIELNWWNTHTHQQVTARLPKWEVNVEAGASNSETPVIEKSDNATHAAAEQTSQPETFPPSPDWFKQKDTLTPWLIASGGLLLLALAALAFIRLRGKKHNAPAAEPEPLTEKSKRIAIKQCLPKLERACTANDTQAAASALLELGRARWPEDPPVNLGTLATRLGQEYEQIMELDRNLYAAGHSSWNGAELWHAVKDAWLDRSTEVTSGKDSLEPLYPQSI